MRLSQALLAFGAFVAELLLRSLVHEEIDLVLFNRLIKTFRIRIRCLVVHELRGRIIFLVFRIQVSEFLLCDQVRNMSKKLRRRSSSRYTSLLIFLFRVIIEILATLF